MQLLQVVWQLSLPLLLLAAIMLASDGSAVVSAANTLHIEDSSDELLLQLPQRQHRRGDDDEAYQQPAIMPAMAQTTTATTTSTTTTITAKPTKQTAIANRNLQRWQELQTAQGMQQQREEHHLRHEQHLRKQRRGAHFVATASDAAKATYESKDQAMLMSNVEPPPPLEAHHLRHQNRFNWEQQNARQHRFLLATTAPSATPTKSKPFHQHHHQQQPQQRLQQHRFNWPRPHTTQLSGNRHSASNRFKFAYADANSRLLAASEDIAIELDDNDDNDDDNDENADNGPDEQFLQENKLVMATTSAPTSGGHRYSLFLQQQQQHQQRQELPPTLTAEKLIKSNQNRNQDMPAARTDTGVSDDSSSEEYDDDDEDGDDADNDDDNDDDDDDDYSYEDSAEYEANTKSSSMMMRRSSYEFPNKTAVKRNLQHGGNPFQKQQRRLIERYNQKSQQQQQKQNEYETTAVANDNDELNDDDVSDGYEAVDKDYKPQKWHHLKQQHRQASRPNSLMASGLPAAATTTTNYDDSENIYSRHYIPGTLTHQKQKELGTSVNVLRAQHLHAQRHAKNKALALSHRDQIDTEASCRVPQRRVERIQHVPSKMYSPHCTILHRCADDTGCCPRSKTCAPKHTQNVELYFFVTSMHENRRGTIERLTFVNHTECHCIERNKLAANRQLQQQAAGGGGGGDYDDDIANSLVQRATILSCTCPKLYEKILQEDGYCRCDCSSSNTGCDWLKRGMEHFSMNDRKCILEGRCKPPTCEYGGYMKKHGRCPRREEQHLESNVLS